MIYHVRHTKNFQTALTVAFCIAYRFINGPDKLYQATLPRWSICPHPVVFICYDTYVQNFLCSMFMIARMTPRISNITKAGLWLIVCGMNRSYEWRP